MSKVLCFGELLLRLSPLLGGAWIANSSMPVYVGGAELNVATALACWGLPVGYLTALPDNYLSEEITSYVQMKGVETITLRSLGNRIGTYYLPQGSDLKNAGVIYDRAYSSFANLKKGQTDWDEVLQDVSWFHFSAISPALNMDVAAVCLEAVTAASGKGITVSIDLNYREKLWQWGKRAGEVMPELVQYCDVVMGNIWAAEKMLGIDVAPGHKDDRQAYLEQAQTTSEEIIKSFPKCRQVANTFRFDRGKGVNYYASLFDGTRHYVSGEHNATYIIDKVGSGDAFMAALIYGNRQEHPAQEIIDFAAAAAFNKLFIKGDTTTTSIEAIKKFYPR